MHVSENVKLGVAGNIDIVFSMTLHCDMWTAERNQTVIHNHLLIACIMFRHLEEPSSDNWKYLLCCI